MGVRATAAIRARDGDPLARALVRLAPLGGLRPFLVTSDFDGTLSEIVLDPWAARVLPAAQRALRRLAALPGVRVALLSGRTAADLAGRARVGGAAYLGNFGLERAWLPPRGRVAALRVRHDPAVAPFAAGAERVADLVAAEVREPWLAVERKGPSVAFHFRAAPDGETARARLAAAVEGADPAGVFRRYAGRRVLELRPPDAAGKGETIRRLVDELRPGALLVLGDDRSDAEMFRVLRDLRAAGTVDGLAVGVHSHAEMPPEVTEEADLVLPSPRAAARLLVRLAGLLAER